MNTMMECCYCKKSFRAFRRTARFCSDSCRVSYNRLPATFATKAGNAWGGMKDVYDLAARFPEKKPEAEKQLAWLQERLNDLRAKFDAKEKHEPGPVVRPAPGVHVRINAPDKPNYGYVGTVTVPLRPFRAIPDNHVWVRFGSMSDTWYCDYPVEDLEAV